MPQLPLAVSVVTEGSTSLRTSADDSPTLHRPFLHHVARFERHFRRVEAEGVAVREVEGITRKLADLVIHQGLPLEIINVSGPASKMATAQFDIDDRECLGQLHAARECRLLFGCAQH